MSPVEGVDLVFWYILGISFLLLIAITGAMVVFAVKYRRSKHPVPATFRDNWKLEIIWTIIPLSLPCPCLRWVGRPMWDCVMFLMTP
ncbi:Cytochrome C oxidase subunit II, transmembrane domain [Candidatus Electrothrix communis]|uniref:Cytochrome C oxidase subunit II, transmembrane domain n=1 Tax=Candidatus Electrothrix communis TaxID=1859133 RepID=A0A444IUH2_9BACT|nr:Cytochrome C oxidase subunit II, transmembrane domain [Candidatus Electrothrix communis]